MPDGVTLLFLKQTAQMSYKESNRSNWIHLKAPNSKTFFRDFPGGPVVKTLHFHCRGHGFDAWLGN